MPVRLRLRRTGTKNKVCYRIVAADSRSPRDGRFIEILGHYNPRYDDEKIDLERVNYWIGNGAKPSKTVAAVIKRVQESPTEPPVSEPTTSLATETEIRDDLNPISHTEEAGSTKPIADQGPVSTSEGEINGEGFTTPSEFKAKVEEESVSQEAPSPTEGEETPSEFKAKVKEESKGEVDGGG